MHYHIKGGKAKCFLTENIILSTFFTKKLVFGPKIGGFRTLQKVPKMVKNDQKLAKNYLKMPKIQVFGIFRTDKLLFDAAQIL